jgi:uncharacterized protein (DUF1499 family)
MTIVKTVLSSVFLLALGVVVFALYRSMQAPTDLWARTGSFPTCPGRPSCVSSIATDDVHRIAPLTYFGGAQAARARLEAVIRAMPDHRILQATPEYLHVLFLTPRMRFRDDAEFLVQPGGVIQVRSLSRFGYGDRGVNRARVEAIRDAFSKASMAKTQ